MGKELSLNKIYDKNSRYINDSRGHELGKEKKVFDLKLKWLKKKRGRYKEDNWGFKSLKW